MDVSSQKVTSEWCDKMVAEGHRIYLQWDGGNDSGSVDLFVDNECISGYSSGNKYNVDPDEIIDRCYEVLDYGGWAWDFSATGTADWSPEKQAFIGEDRYAARNEYDESFECNIKVTVPEDLWFSELAIDLRTDPWDGDNSAKYLIEHGFLSVQHEDDQDRLEQEIRPQLEAVLLKARETLEFKDEVEVEGTAGEAILSRSMFTKEGDKLVCYIKDIQLETVHVTYKSIEVEFLKTEVDEQV